MLTKYQWIKKGFIYKPQQEFAGWHDHAMAPAPFLKDEDTIRVYVGGWDENHIARIGYIDVDAHHPARVKKVSSHFVLDIGKDGCFDDNGVFPAHVYKHPDGRVFLYYTGFQKLAKIPFSNFSGLAISTDNGDTFQRVSQAPVMDRADEGLYTRAGTSVIYEDGVFKACYSVGSGWYHIAGKDRPIYEVNYSESQNGIDFPKCGQKAVPVDLTKEHGLGRPQIVKLLGKTFCFYTRRTLDFKYFIGCSFLEKGHWVRADQWLSTIPHGQKGEFDCDMVYFPAVIDTGEKIFLFYVGNGYGKDGFGYAELIKHDH
ncbi:hypothetical protein [Candidatus Avelusimicrobium facis]|uniref:hypothetical protein n=1 Tax=Candidatus Avelusimicrobium facis TaxID=3416203 RepID=UPI003D0A9869